MIHLQSSEGLPVNVALLLGTEEPSREKTGNSLNVI